MAGADCHISIDLMMVKSKPIKVNISGSNWTPEIANGIFVQWCISFSMSELGFSQWSGPNQVSGSITLSNSTAELRFIITPSSILSWEITEVNGIDAEKAKKVINLAAAKTREGNSGTDLVYQVAMECQNPSFSPNMIRNMFRVMGDQVAISGTWRLSDLVLLDFTQDSSPNPGPALFAPETKITATLFALGPVHGPLAGNMAQATFETVAAICAFALGRPVDMSDFVYFPISIEAAENQLARRSNSAIRNLPRDSTSLDIFDELMSLGGTDAANRARSSFVTLHEAQRQANADIAVMLYVCAIEAIITPGRQCKWRKERVTKRFRDAILILCERAVDKLLAHQNVETALGFSKRGNISRQRNDLLDRIYDLRSMPTHSGVGPRNISIYAFADEGSIRVALLSDLARAVLLAYIKAPMSFLTGHPALDPPQSCR
jgi:hypothetical protein